MVEAPSTANPGENITVTLSVDSTLEKIDFSGVTVKIYALQNETDPMLLKTINLFYLSSKNESVAIPSNVSSGLTYGEIECNWSCYDEILDVWIRSEISAGFPVTYVRNTQLQELQKEYEELNETYNNLMSNYTSLNNTYTELESRYEASAGQIAGTRNLMYVFIATTVIAGVTAVLIVVRKPKSGTYF